MAIAGEPNRERRAPQARPTGGALNLQCWPAQRTHEVPYNFGYIPVPPPPPPAPMMAYEADGAEAIMVTASRQKMARAQMAPVAAVVAEQEDLGDLKLYRIPEPVSVNAKGQKQVAMIVKPNAAFERLYVANVNEVGDGGSQPMAIMLRSENRKEKGLGLPMPSGQIMVFEDSNYGPLLAGQASLTDRAVGDDVEMRVGTSSDVRVVKTLISQNRRKQIYKIDVSNARNEAVNVEIEIPHELGSKPKNVTKIDGVPTWKATVPANGDASFHYELKPES
jgi:hypothetical protein